MTAKNRFPNTRESMIRTWQDPEYRARVLPAMRKAMDVRMKKQLLEMIQKHD